MTILMTLKALSPQGSLSRWFTYNNFILRALVVLVFDLILVSVGRLYFSPILGTQFGMNLHFEEALSEASLS